MPWTRNRRLNLVPEADAEPRTLEIYGEIKRVLGVPQVNLLFEAYAVFPKFLDVYWQSIKRVFLNRQFFECADRLRADAYTRVHSYFSIPDFCQQMTELSLSVGGRRELAHATELFVYNDPLLLLTAAYQARAFEGDGAPLRASGGGAVHPVYSKSPIQMDERSAPPEVKKIYEEIKAALQLPFLNPEYRAFARWPDFLKFYWATLKPALSHPLYEVYKIHMRESALNLAGQLPMVSVSVQALQEAEVPQQEINGAMKVTEALLDVFAGLVLNVTIAKIGLEGGNQPGKGRRPEEQAKEGLHAA